MLDQCVWCKNDGACPKAAAQALSGCPHAVHTAAPAPFRVGREAMVTQAFGQVSWLRLNSQGLGSDFPSTVRRGLLIPFYG